MHLDNSTSPVNQKLALLYSKVTFFIGFKAVSPDASVANVTTGTALPRVWEYSDACKNLESQRQYAFANLQKQHGAAFARITGRALQLSDLRASFTPADKHLSAVMLDDIEDTCGAHVNIETSPGNFQGHFRLSRLADDVEAMCCIRMLRDWHSSDPGAAKSRQSRRFLTSGLSGSIEYWDEESVDVDFAIKHFPKAEVPAIAMGAAVALTAMETKLYSEIWERKRLATICAQHPTGNRSDADFRVACYVLEKNGTPGKARAAIVCSRLSLHDKKGAYTSQYLQTTVNNAVEADLKKRANAPRKLSI